MDGMPSPGAMNEKMSDQKNHYSFHTDDSFDLLCMGPNIIKKRPSNVPPLNLYGLPEYESSSDEDDNQGAVVNGAQIANGQNPQQYYQESLKYIENFYNKYAMQQAVVGGGSSQSNHIPSIHGSNQHLVSTSSNGNLYRDEHNLSKTGTYTMSMNNQVNHVRDSSLMNGGNIMNNGCHSSMQQMSYYDYLSRDEDDMSPQMDQEEEEQ